jgi:hypothetical protein
MKQLQLNSRSLPEVLAVGFPNSAKHDQRFGNSL